MKHVSVSMVVVVFAALIGGAACSRVEPFIYDPAELNRSAKGFGRPKTDISEVMICYNRSGTRPETLTAMARAECGRFGKVPRYTSQDVEVCPLIAPVRITYACVAP